jgi:hypothetical protein
VQRDSTDQLALAWTSEAASCESRGRTALVTSSAATTRHNTIMAGLNPPSIKLPGLSLHPEGNGANNGNGNVGRARSRSVLKVEHVDSSNEEALDQATYANINAEWVNRKGAQRSDRRRDTVS